MIQLQFSTENSIGSELIRTFDHGWCSHVDAVLADGTLLGARSDGGVLIRPKNYAPFSRIAIVNLDTTDTIEDNFYNFLKLQVGKPYDTTAIEAFIFNRNWKEEDSWFCSELISYGLSYATFFKYPLSTPSNRITPSDLMLVCSIFTEF